MVQGFYSLAIPGSPGEGGMSPSGRAQGWLCTVPWTDCTGCILFFDMTRLSLPAAAGRAVDAFDLRATFLLKLLKQDPVGV